MGALLHGDSRGEDCFVARLSEGSPAPGRRSQTSAPSTSAAGRLWMCRSAERAAGRAGIVTGTEFEGISGRVGCLHGSAFLMLAPLPACGDPLRDLAIPP